jgi:hypothetical protein
VFGRLNNQLVDGGQYKAESEEKRTGVSFIEQGGRIFHIFLVLFLFVCFFLNRHVNQPEFKEN